jgi:hypothetical protein
MQRSESVLTYHQPVLGVSVGDQLQSIAIDLEYFQDLQADCNDPLELLDLNVAIKMLQAITNYLQSS